MSDHESSLERQLREAVLRYVDALGELTDVDADDDGHMWLDSLASLASPRTELTKTINNVSKATGYNSGRARILAYLQSNVGRPVQGEQLAAVAGIGEWARRVRELRVEFGYNIQTYLSNPELNVDEYLLVDSAPDEARADRWQMIDAIRSDKGLTNSRQKLLEFLQYLEGDPATAEELQEVAKVASYARRIRELREQGWQIEGYGEDINVPFGGYRLASPVQLQGRQRQAIAQRYRLLEEADFRCADCGVSSRQSKSVQLQVHHRRYVRHGGDNDPANLVVLCRHCHAGIHALDVGSVADELIHPEADPFGSSHENGDSEM